MSRPIANPGLRLLLERAMEREQGYLALVDLAAECGCTPDYLGRYARGLQPARRVEFKMAKFFRISIGELRRKLNLNGRNQRCTPTTCQSSSLGGARRARG